MNSTVSTVLAVPAGLGLFWLVLWTPKTKRQWAIAGIIVVYVAIVWFFVIRKMH
jgi:preprotein translocase subunit YajC